MSISSSFYSSFPFPFSTFSSSGEGELSKAVYDCFGVSNHSGNLHGGHYTATCRHPYNESSWHVYNDRCVSGTTSDAVVTPEAYLLFFYRKDTVSLDQNGEHE